MSTGKGHEAIIQNRQVLLPTNLVRDQQHRNIDRPDRIDQVFADIFHVWIAACDQIWSRLPKQ